jgi:5-formyltetrahydrofolate cyclo-ligase
MADDAEVIADKQRLRSRIEAARRALAPTDVDAARRSVASAVLARCDADADAGRPWRHVFGYEAINAEPSSPALLNGLLQRGCSVYLPVLRADRDLDWRHAYGSSPHGVERHGVERVRRADAVLVPAFAVDFAGMRLGRGGGSYDRVLARVPATAALAALLHRGELVEQVPAQSWDRPVRSVVTPDGWLDLPQ